MYLYSIEIQGFRGIPYLMLSFDPKQKVIIGENTWGNASCLNALALLSSKYAHYQFSHIDFHRFRLP